jgi:hypothetical protein
MVILMHLSGIKTNNFEIYINPSSVNLGLRPKFKYVKFCVLVKYGKLLSHNSKCCKQCKFLNSNDIWNTLLIGVSKKQSCFKLMNLHIIIINYQKKN